jgi:hypothetical protein
MLIKGHTLLICACVRFCGMSNAAPSSWHFQCIVPAVYFRRNSSLQLNRADGAANTLIRSGKRLRRSFEARSSTSRHDGHINLQHERGTHRKVGPCSVQRTAGQKHTEGPVIFDLTDVGLSTCQASVHVFDLDAELLHPDTQALLACSYRI